MFFQRQRPTDPRAGISTTTLADSLIDSGKLDVQKGEYDSAVNKFTTAIQLVPNSAPAFLNRGAAYERAGKYSEAIADYERASELRPNDLKLQLRSEIDRLKSIRVQQK